MISSDLPKKKTKKMICSKFKPDSPSRGPQLQKLIGRRKKVGKLSTTKCMRAYLMNGLA